MNQKQAEAMLKEAMDSAEIFPLSAAAQTLIVIAWCLLEANARAEYEAQRRELQDARADRLRPEPPF